MEQRRRIIDRRVKEKFMMDDEYLNGQAKLCGWQGTIVYNSLCRHVNTNQESFPSIQLMAEQHGVSRPTILKGIENLEKRRVIAVKKMRTKGGQWLNNTYILLDKSEWDYGQIEDSQVNVVDMDQVNVDTPPSQRGLLDQVNVVDTKETHKQGNTYKETHIAAEPPNEINSLLNFFKNTVNEHISFGNKTERKACADLLKTYGLEKTKQALLFVEEKRKTDRYLPVITTPYELWTKWAKIKQHLTTEQATKKGTLIL